MAKIRVLLVEDDAAYARLVEAALTTSEIEFDVIVVDRLEAALGAIARRGHNLILLDLNLPDSTGLDTLQEIVRVASEIPIIVLTGQEDTTIASRTLAMGAQRFLRKTEMSTSSLIEVMRQAVSMHLKMLTKSSDQTTIGEVLDELEQSAVRIEGALAVFDVKRLDTAESNAITSARRHVGNMKATISSFRTP